MGLGSIARLGGISPPAASKHLAELEKLGVLTKFVPLRSDMPARPIWRAADPQRIRSILKLLELVKQHAELSVLFKEVSELTRSPPPSIRQQLRLKELFAQIQSSPYSELLSDDEKKKKEFWEVYLRSRH